MEKPIKDRKKHLKSKAEREGDAAFMALQIRERKLRGLVGVCAALGIDLSEHLKPKINKGIIWRRIKMRKEDKVMVSVEMLKTCFRPDAGNPGTGVLKGRLRKSLRYGIPVSEARILIDEGLAKLVNKSDELKLEVKNEEKR
jgi:hypothetical protein